MHKLLLNLWVVLTFGTVSTLAPAQTPAAWPAAKPISVVVPFAAGGAVDYAARMVVNKLGERLGQSMVATVATQAARNSRGAAGASTAGCSVDAAARVGWAQPASPADTQPVASVAALPRAQCRRVS